MPFDPSSREAEAQAEIAATRLGRGVAGALVAGFLVLLALGPLFELGAAVQDDSKVFVRFDAAAESRAGLRGALARTRERFLEIEARFDERSALVRLVRPPTQELLTRAAGYGNERALVGRDGWLY
ncbi:MAG TPA: hypothetical protein VI942_09035, partial [Thermoanaerobaculia bacterium]|nr:hypothetical protein [Thermoanaerobaculia bacterium]